MMIMYFIVLEIKRQYNIGYYQPGAHTKQRSNKIVELTYVIAFFSNSLPNRILYEKFPFLFSFSNERGKIIVLNNNRINSYRFATFDLTCKSNKLQSMWFIQSNGVLINVLNKSCHILRSNN